MFALHNYISIFFFQKCSKKNKKCKKLLACAHHVHGHVAPHVGGGDPVEDCGSGHGPKALGAHVEEGAEHGHLRADQVGEGDSRVDVSAAHVADGLDERGGRHAETEGVVENIVGARGPAQRRAQPEEHKEHGAVELGEHRSPERHGPKLPHGCTLRLVKSE